ncbi:glutamate synthase large subunit, partial [Ancylomarina sp. 16SWW S1-10-2]
TGDGCGLLIQKPDTFFRDVIRNDFGIELSKKYGIGSIMLSKEAKHADKAKAIFTEEMAAQGLEVVAWRTVPTNSECLGPIALESQPDFVQVFINSEGLNTQELAAKLLVARRKANKQLRNDDWFYVASLSEKIVSYKGLMMPVDLPRFFP